MSIYRGANRIIDLYRGGNRVRKVYRGANQVWGDLYTALDTGTCTAADITAYWTVSDSGGTATMTAQAGDTYYECRVIGDTTDPVWSLDLSNWLSAGDYFIIEIEWQAFIDSGAGDSYNFGVSGSATGTGYSSTWETFWTTTGPYVGPVTAYSASTRYFKVNGILTLNSGDRFEITNIRVRKV